MGVKFTKSELIVLRTTMDMYNSCLGTLKTFPDKWLQYGNLYIPNCSYTTTLGNTIKNIKIISYVYAYDIDGKRAGTVIMKHERIGNQINSVKYSTNDIYYI